MASTAGGQHGGAVAAMTTNDKKASSGCPCSDVAMETMYDALSSEERSRKLMDWLSGTFSFCCTDDNDDDDDKIRDCNVRKVSASFHILNAIRAACRPHLEANSSNNNNKSPGKPQESPTTTSQSQPQTYEESFPSLSANNKPPKSSSGKQQVPPTTTTKVGNNNNNNNNLMTNNNNNGKKKKKRIRPVAAVSPITGTTGVWGNIAKQQPIELHHHHQISTTTTKNNPQSSSNHHQQSNKNAFFPQTTNTIIQTTPSRLNNHPTSTPQKPPKSPVDLTANSLLRTPDTKPNAVTTRSSGPHPNQDTTIPITTERTTNKEVISPAYVVHVAKPTKSVPKVTPASQVQIDRFVELYCTLIWNNLVPSTALEVHLLLRLLNLVHHGNRDDSTPTLPPKPEETLILAPIFPDATYCQSFAAKVLSRLSILLKQFGIAFLQDLVKIPAFRCHLPELTRELEREIQVQTAAGGLLLRAPEQSSIISGGASSQTAILTLPFQHDRDSRHNYKTRDEQQLYKNREESRDAFLYQLRSFLNVRGKMLDTVQAQRAIQKIRTSSRMVVDGVMSVNLAWFAQFFCDLLLQVGLVPIEETDKELLNIAGKEKLQKLHKRFSSRVGGNNNKSSWKLTSANGKRQAESSMSTFEQAQQHFPGHQEFFFLFMLSADSYKWNFHLRSQIIHRIKSELSTTDNHLSMHLEKSLLNMQMLAKFLGVIIFSPTWQEFEKYNAYGTTRDMTPPDGLEQLESDVDANLSLINLVREAKKNGHLTTVIPWITDILKMASWDTSIHRRSKVYRRLLRLLREIQEQLCSDIHNPRSRVEKPCCVQLVYFSLETFFGETIGLARAASLKQGNETPVLHENSLPSSSGTESDSPSLLDDTPLLFSNAVLFSANVHIEELFSLSSTLARINHNTKPGRSPGVSRKLRPVVISRDVSSASSNNETKEPELVVKGSPLASPSPGPPAVTGLSVPRMSGPGGSSLQAKLVDSFFHQHREMKDICEFAVHQILKRMAVSIPEKFVKPLVKQDPHLLCEETIQHTVNEALKYLRSSLEEGVNQSLCLFEPSDTHPKVHELAVSLAVARGYESGSPHVTNLVTNDLKPLQRSLFEDQPDRNEESEAILIKKGEPPVQTESEELVAKMTTAVNALVTCILADLKNGGGYNRILECIHSLEPLLDEWLDSKLPKIPSESYLRDYFESVAKLDLCSVSVLEELCTTSHYSDSSNIISEQRWLLLVSFLRMGLKLSKHPRRGLSRVIKYLKRDPDCLSNLIRMGLFTTSSSDDSCNNTLVELLLDMVEANFLSINLLEEVLIRNAKTDDEVIFLALSKQFLSQLQQRPNVAFDMPMLKSFINSHTNS